MVESYNPRLRDDLRSSLVPWIVAKRGRSILGPFANHSGETGSAEAGQCDGRAYGPAQRWTDGAKC